MIRSKSLDGSPEKTGRRRRDWRYSSIRRGRRGGRALARGQEPTVAATVEQVRKLTTVHSPRRASPTRSEEIALISSSTKGVRGKSFRFCLLSSLRRKPAVDDCPLRTAKSGQRPTVRRSPTEISHSVMTVITHGFGYHNRRDARDRRPTARSEGSRRELQRRARTALGRNQGKSRGTARELTTQEHNEGRKPVPRCHGASRSEAQHADQ